MATSRCLVVPDDGTPAQQRTFLPWTGLKRCSRGHSPKEDSHEEAKPRCDTSPAPASRRLAEAYAAAYRIALKANCEPGPAHFAALKAMDLASDIYRS